MTSHELARKLLAGPDAPVHFVYPVGDYWKTTAAPQVERIEEAEITDRTSIGVPRLITDEDRERDGRDEDFDAAQEYRTVIVIK